MHKTLFWLLCGHSAKDSSRAAVLHTMCEYASLFKCLTYCLHCRIYRPSAAGSAADDTASTSQPVAGRSWLETELGRPPTQPRRTRLPDPKQPLPGINLFSLIKDWIGKDIHKLALPTHINEPLTDLQRRAEAFEHSELLDDVSYCCFNVVIEQTVCRSQKVAESDVGSKSSA